MGTPTEYTRSFSGSIGSGMKSLMGGSKQRYYVLEHKVSSRYHKAGESQKIIVDQIELGRSANCQVRFDDNFSTVSRRHAAIVRDGDNWKLVQLSQTNSTYLNGIKVKKEWYLQSGDEIQLSTNGPKLGFIVPQGDKGLVKSIGLTARLNLFRQQALHPYKQALMVLSCILVLCIIGGAWWIVDQHGKIDNLADALDASRQRNIELSDTFHNQMAEMELKRKRDSVDFAQRVKRAEEEARRLRDQGSRGDGGLGLLMDEQNLKKDVFYLYTTKVVAIIDGREVKLENPDLDSDGLVMTDESGNVIVRDYGWGGTAFLLDDGRLVTARHCVQGWWFQTLNEVTIQCLPSVMAAALSAGNPGEIKLRAHFLAVSTMSGKQFELTSDDFVFNESEDEILDFGSDEDGNALKWHEVQNMSTDWAYTTKTNGSRGGIKADPTLSRNMTDLSSLLILGFPVGLGVGDGIHSGTIDPIPSESKTARQGLDSDGLIMYRRATDYGNSGGPVFALDDDGLLVAVGIVSHGSYETDLYDWAVPISQINR